MKKENKSSQDFYTYSSVVTSMLSPDIKLFFDNDIAQDDNFLYCLREELGYTSKKFLETISLDIIVRYVLEISIFSAANTAEIERKYLEQKRNYKKYWLKGLREEMGELPITPRNKLLLEKDSSMYWNLKSSKAPIDANKFTTVGEYKQYRFEEIKKWYDSKNSRLFDYAFFYTLKSKQKANAFLTDIFCEVLYIVIHDLYSNLEEGYLTKLPEVVFDNPYFNYRQSDMQLKFEFDEDKINIYEEYEHNERVVGTIVKNVPLQNASTSNPDVDAANIIERLKIEYALDERAKDLDAVDMQVLAIVCSSITGSTMANETLKLTLKNICHTLYGSEKLRTRHYKTTLKRLEKLANYRLYTQKIDANGPSEKIILHLMDIHYIVPLQKGALNKDQNYISDLDSFDFDFFNGKDISETILEITPGKTLRDSWKEDKIARVYSNLYNSIEDNKARTFLFILEAERLRNNPSLDIRLPYTFFQERLRFDVKKNILRDEIIKNLEFLKQQNVLIDSYKLDIMYVSITFLPFTEIERLVYKLSEVPALAEN